MATFIQYGNYTFPEPLPLVSFSSDPIYQSGVLDHARKRVEVVGLLTGDGLAGLHTAKMQMISGMSTGYLDVVIGAATGESNTGTFSGCKPTSINFQDSDLTTVLPYTVSFEYLEGKDFSQMFGIEQPVDKWAYVERENRIVGATHTVSARGIKVSTTGDDPLQRAFEFVSGRMGGFENISTMIDGDGGILKSRSENINRSNFQYGMTEVYDFSQSSLPISDSGIVTAETSISFSKEAGLRASVAGSIEGSITGAKLDTGQITKEMGQEILYNAVHSTMSDFESGVYQLAEKLPRSVEYNLNTGDNVINFSFGFEDLEEASQTGLVLHKYVTSVNVNKSSPVATVSVNGSLEYNNPFEILPTGDPVSSDRWTAVDQEFSGLNIYALAVGAVDDFATVATEYSVDSSLMNEKPVSVSINKKPNQTSIDYEFSFDNKLDLSSGVLDDLSISITDKRPIQVTKIFESTQGFLSQLVNNRSLGEYSVNGTSKNTATGLMILSGIVNDLVMEMGKPEYVQSVNLNTGANQITVNKSSVY